jgi:hypothetical protein
MDRSLGADRSYERDKGPGVIFPVTLQLLASRDISHVDNTHALSSAPDARPTSYEHGRAANALRCDVPKLYDSRSDNCGVD